MSTESEKKPKKDFNSKTLEHLLTTNDKHHKYEQRITEHKIANDEKHKKLEHAKDDVKIEQLHAIAAGVKSLKPTIEKHASTTEKMSKFLEEMKGEPGYTPIKGKDYFTQEELNEMRRQVTPKRGRDYMTLSDIRTFVKHITPVKGKHYKDGEPGYTPQKGIDYFDGEPGKRGPKGDSIKGDQGEPGIPGKNGKAPSVNAIIKKIKEGKALSINDLQGIDNIYSQIRSAAARGPKMAGTGYLREITDVDITGLLDGYTLVYNKKKDKWLVAAGGASATNFADEEVPSGTINGSNTGFTLAHTPTVGSVKLFINGSRVSVIGGDYTISGKNITTATAPPTGSVIVADYRY